MKEKWILKNERRKRNTGRENKEKMKKQVEEASKI